MWEATGRSGNIEAGERCARCGRVTTARVAPGLRCNRCVAEAISTAIPRTGRIRELDVRAAFAASRDDRLLA